jgi:uracil-DNA glycosylase family 4
MKTFCFFEKEIEQAKLQQEAQRKSVRQNALPTVEQCDTCGLHRMVRSPKMTYNGKGQLGILVIGEGPGGKEDLYNKQFHELGDAGAKIREHLSVHGIDLDKDCWSINAINCRPTTPDGKSNRTPTYQELVYCRPRMMRTIQELQPKRIFLFGASATESYLMDRSDSIRRSAFEEKKGQKRSVIDTWRGLHFPDIRYDAWVYLMLHPAYLLRNPAAEHVFARDLKEALQHQAPLLDIAKICNLSYKSDWTKHVKPIVNFDDITAFLKRVVDHEFDTISIDYETTGLKPFREGHEIVSFSVGYLLNGFPRAVSIPLSHPGSGFGWEKEAILLQLKAILSDASIGKVAHNIQMEEKWSRKIVGCEVQGWKWDTMQTAHIIDERDLFTSLDKQVFLMTGYEYGQNIAFFKKGFPFNRMNEAPLLDLLMYGGLDALFTKILSQDQESYLETQPRLRTANDFWLKSTLSFCDLEYAGINIDEKYYKRKIAEIDAEMDGLKNIIDRSEEVLTFKQTIGRFPDLGDKGGDTKDLATLLFNVLKLVPLKQTAKGKNTLDDDFLEKNSDTPICGMISKLRKLNKIKTTYLSGYVKEVVDEKIYPSSNLNLVRTFRSSMDSPNMQNVPARDEEAKKIVRSGIIPPKGFRIATADYGSHEVRIIASYFKDPALIHDVSTGHDLHGDYAKIMELDKQRPWKQARYDAKNAFVFPTFYGSWYENIGKDLRNRGYDIDDSTVQKAERFFWHKYNVTKKAQKELIEFYQQNGYIELFWGHRRRGIISKNQISNSTIQGSAFHCLLWSLNRAIKRGRLEGWKSYIPAQIHDELFCYVHESEIKYFVKAVTKIMQEDIVAENPFILVPLIAEWSFCEPGQPWYNKKSVDPDKLDEFLEAL